MAHTEMLTGWGRAAAGTAEVVDVTVRELLDHGPAPCDRGTIARGLGRSYGDAAQNSGGRVVRLHPDETDPCPSIVLHADVPAVTAHAAASIDDLIAFLVPRGYFVPVTPGTRHVTVGGAIASDIHGKNHHIDGSFGAHVTSLRLLTADDEVVEIGPDRQPDLFWATVGGMGLTGIVLDATFAVLPVDTGRIKVQTRRIDNLDDVMQAMVASDRDHRYSVAWLDTLAKGRHLGRGVLTNGEHARLDDLPESDRDRPLRYAAGQLAALPPLVPTPGIINRLTVSAFNEMWYRKAPKHRDGELQSIPTYFHPLDLVGGWNKVYGRSGFLQYQFVVPTGADDVLRDIIGEMSAAALASFLTVLKRFGPNNPGHLSFPTGGWTLAVDVSTRYQGLGAFLRRMDDRVLDAGGRHYLAKDHHMTPADLRRGYPRLDDWLEIRERVDPNHRWASDQSRRLGLTPTTKR